VFFLLTIPISLSNNMFPFIEGNFYNTIRLALPPLTDKRFLVDGTAAESSDMSVASKWTASTSPSASGHVSQTTPLLTIFY
jgi:hypothetical protein